MVTDPLTADQPLTPVYGGLAVNPLITDWVLTLTVAGEADAATARLLRQQLSDACAAWPYAVVIDLTELTFCGLAGLDVLNDALARNRPQGTVTVTGMSSQLVWLHHTFSPSPSPSPSPTHSRRDGLSPGHSGLHRFVP